MTDIPTNPKLAALRQMRMREAMNLEGGGISLMAGAGAVDVPAKMAEDYAGYWKLPVPIGKVEAVAVGSGGWLMRVAQGEAVYGREGVEPFTIRPTSNLNLIANIDPAIAQAWREAYGFIVIPV